MKKRRNAILPTVKTSFDIIVENQVVLHCLEFHSRVESWLHLWKIQTNSEVFFFFFSQREELLIQTLPLIKEENTW